jgi:collagen type VII alpha
MLPSTYRQTNNNDNNGRSCMRINTSIVAAAAVGLLVGVPSAGAAAHHFVTGTDVKDSSLTSKDVRNLSLHSKDFDKKVQKALKLRAKKGAVGAAGINGVNGANGALGSAGAQGKAGLKGDTGAQGAQGAQGDRGDTGGTGAAGAQGEQGATGAPGATGATGATGAPGIQGARGADGLSAFVVWQQSHPGQSEEQFLIAIKGADGRDGVENVAAADPDACKYGGWVITFSTGDDKLICNGKDGKDGVKGDKGDAGLNGAAGADGVKGETGDKGDKGEKGSNGLNGDRGEKGENGERGDKGEQGERGNNGDHGLSAYEDWLTLNGYNRDDHTVGDFIKALHGAKGDTGADGQSGSNGHDGSNGRDGDNGRSAYQEWLLGEDRTAGTDDDNSGSVGDFMSSLHGKNGAKGDTGDTGSIGDQGVKGDKGDRGTDGGQGPQGEHGNNGAKGDDAYQVWLEAGNMGDRAAFIGSLKVTGPKGDKGDQGAMGHDGAPGQDGQQGPKGDTGIASMTVIPATITSNDQAADVSCPVNMVATGGGGEANSGSTLVENAPKLNAQGKAVGWHIKDTSSGTKSRKVYVLCAPTS